MGDQNRRNPQGADPDAPQDAAAYARVLEESRRANRFLGALARAQSRFIAESDPRTTFNELLDILLELTGSEYGFIGEVLRTGEGKPYLRTHAITNIAWNEETQAFYARYAATGLEFHSIDTLFGAVLVTGETVIANDPANDPRGAGTPPGHPPLLSFLGLPFLFAGVMVGMVGIANRPGGYDAAVVQYLEPFRTTCASLVAAFRNQRRRQEAEAELRTLNAELARVNQELGDFAHSVSHDLKSPLRSIEGYGSLLRQRHGARLDDEGRRLVDRVREAAGRMGRLIDDLLLYAQVERRPLAVETMDLRAMVAELLAAHEAEIAGRNLTIEVEIPWATMTADRGGLDMALRNLLGNALKFTRDVADPRIEIAGQERERAWIVWVRDNGCGFDMHHRDRLFELFHRLHRADEYGGTGVGLALVRKAVQRMGGRVWAESEPGHGAAFYLEIPRPG